MYKCYWGGSANSVRPLLWVVVRAGGENLPCCSLSFCLGQRKESLRRVLSPGESMRRQARGLCLSEFWQKAFSHFELSGDTKLRWLKITFLKSPGGRVANRATRLQSVSPLSHLSDESQSTLNKHLFRSGRTSNPCFIECLSLKAVAFCWVKC